MSAIPAALRNAWAVSFGDGIEAPDHVPTSTIYDEPHRHLRKYESTTSGTGNPILLVPPLAVTTMCYDLRPEQSLARFLLGLGRDVYVVDYGEITYADRNLGFEEWTHDIVPTAIRRVSAEHGGAQVDLIGWSFGGTISILTGAADTDLPIASITAVGTPFDQRKNPGTAAPRAIAPYTGGRELTLPIKLFGGIPSYAVRAGFKVQALQRELTKPAYIVRNLDNREALARMQSIDRFMADMPGYPERFYRQAYRRLIARNEMWRGTIHLSRDHVISLAHLTCPVLLLGSRRDVLAPAKSVAAGVEVLTGSRDARFVEVPGSHLGMLAGPEARDTSWRAIADFLGERLPARA